MAHKMKIIDAYRLKKQLINELGYREAGILSMIDDQPEVLLNRNSTGEVEQTEQEYIQTCNTEQLAEFLYDIAYFDNWSDAIMNDSLINETAVEYAIEKWLKQPHTTE